jgi:hypothetical protein
MTATFSGNRSGRQGVRNPDVRHPKSGSSFSGNTGLGRGAIYWQTYSLYGDDGQLTPEALADGWEVVRPVNPSTRDAADC